MLFGPKIEKNVYLRLLHHIILLPYFPEINVTVRDEQVRPVGDS